MIENDFPLKFIFDTINNRIKDITRKKLSRTSNLENNKESINPSWFTVSYVPILTEKFRQFDRNNIKVSYYSTNKLKKFIKVHKYPLDSFSNVVYKINCNEL